VDTLGARAASVLIGVATGLVILAVVIPLFLNPLWVGFEQGRAEATAWTGFTEPQLRVATDSILSDLVVGPPDFDVAVDGTPVLNERERSHMRDVRSVFIGFFAIIAIVTVAAVLVALRRRGDARRATWRSVRQGAIGLIIGLLIVGGFAVIAFDVLFEIFHRLFFAGGSYTFDPSTDRLVQLFPFAFWDETAMVLGVVAAVVAGVVALVAHRRSTVTAEPATGTPTAAAQEAAR
jgi:integral membrane protein (TIGR01906 family)